MTKICHLKTITIPIIGAQGIIKKNTNAHIKKIPGNLSLSKIQNSTDEHCPNTEKNSI